VFELLEQGEVLPVPTTSPLDEKEAWLVFRDVVLGLEYCKIFHILKYKVIFEFLAKICFFQCIFKR